ncbi:carbonic anhydrase [Pseudohongiella sp.]|uniref:carbonic anhydrase n=1 Tax=marine sediment metagenome TaxID=412755 RepID=A0A0F9W5P5_9ZZZZ|nr:carbonic anhydrase [Pseudohongiella sp.]HDZ09696.1 carbonic anhydrase [Pseudohongiella sp.]HEA61885.1 carbonic anhydrase [Pseudohongiella sp.]
MSEKLLEGYKRFKEGYYAQNREKIRELAQDQRPSYVLITCCDARLEPSRIFDTEPGDLFVIRNVANLVPPYEVEGSYHGTSAALQYAITVLEAPEIIVLGHSRCGGIRSLVLDPDKMEKDSFISRWMSIVAPVAKLADPDKLNDPKTFSQCEQAAIGFSLRNLLTYPWIASRVAAGTLQINGWHYNIYSGALKKVHDQDTISTIVEASDDASAD